MIVNDELERVWEDEVFTRPLSGGDDKKHEKPE
jgi:hypothetical protein